MMKEQLMADISLREKYFEALIDILIEQQEALERLVRFATELCQDVNVSAHQPSIERAQAALAAIAEKLKALGCLK